MDKSMKHNSYEMVVISPQGDTETLSPTTEKTPSYFYRDSQYKPETVDRLS